MKLTSVLATTAFASALGFASTQAATIASFPGTGEGAPYRYSVTLGETDAGEVIRRVGAWAWEDKSLFGSSGTDTAG